MTKHLTSDLISSVETGLEKIPGVVQGDAKEKLQELQELMWNARAPRFALVGRRGSGKSSLINAIFAEEVARVGHERAETAAATWRTFEGERGTLELLDTRGVQEGSRPDTAEEGLSALASVIGALKETTPDALLFVVKASEVDSAIDGDLDALEKVYSELGWGREVPLIGVLSHCDIVEPKNYLLHEEGGADQERLEKLERIERLEADLERKIVARRGLSEPLSHVLGLSSYMSWAADGRLRADERWRVERLIEYLLHDLPDDAQVALARVSQVKEIQRKVARRVINASVVLSGAVAATPLPLADVVPLTALQVNMVAMIGYISGRSIGKREVAEFMAGLGLQIGVGLGLREIARSVLKLVPGAGTAVNAAVAGTGTKALGQAAMFYFIDGHSMSVVRKLWKSREEVPTEE